MITFPLALPTSVAPASISFTARSAVSASISPFSYAQQIFVHTGEMWEAEVAVPVMRREDAEVWVAFLLALNGREGTFTMGDPLNTSPRGTWATPQVQGAHAARAKTIAIDELAPGATGKAGDWLQFGSGSTARLHKLVQDFTADGTGAASIEIWPSTRTSIADNADITLLGAKGVWRLASNDRSWVISTGQLYSLAFAAVEAL